MLVQMTDACGIDGLPPRSQQCPIEFAQAQFSHHIFEKYYKMVVEVYPPDHGRATLNSLEHGSVTVPSLGKLSSSPDSFTFASNF